MEGFSGAVRDWPLESGRRRLLDIHQPGAHRRPRGEGGVLPGRVLLMRNMTTPMGSGSLLSGKPTVREAELLSGRRMTQEANAGGRKGSRKPGQRGRLLRRPSRITGRIRAVARA